MKILQQTYLLTLSVLFYMTAASPVWAAEITVNGSTCTLGEAIISANNDSAGGNGCVNGSGVDTILLMTGVTLVATLPQISSTITIEGGGHFISGNNAPDVGSVLHINDTGNLTLNETMVTEGRGHEDAAGYRYGGGIYNNGTVTLNNSTVNGNSAFVDSFFDDAYAYGGGIYNKGIVTLNDSTVSDNSVSSSSAYLAYLYGGGIYNEGTVTLNRSTVSGNSADARGHAYSKAHGGGIYNSGIVILSDSTVSGNFAYASTNAYDADAYAGGIYNKGTITLTNSTVSDNSVDALSSSYGGGIYNKGTITLSNSTVSGNSARANALSNSYGGGIYNEGTVTLTNSTVSDNSAKNSGGGIYNSDTITLTNSTVSRNSVKDYGFPNEGAHVYGGGIYNKGTVTLTNSTVSGNTADADSPYDGAYAHGGGIYNEGMVTLTNSTVSSNSTDASSINAYDAYAHGGGIFNLGLDSTVTLSNSLVSGNSADKGNEVYNEYSGDIYANNYNLFGHSGESNTDAFFGFTPVGTDVDATGYDGSALENILTPLADNGGPTWTHALPEGSPAIDLAECSDGLTTDQRGYPRPSGDGCDAGSFELVLNNLIVAIETLQDTAAAIDILVPSAFKGKNNRKNLTNGINEVLTLIEAELYADALQKLEGGSILGKTDGCANSAGELNPAPDTNDWIKECASQEQIYPLIMETIGSLQGI